MAKKANSWRVQGGIGSRDNFVELKDHGTSGFDELVVVHEGVCMIHVEAMDQNSYFMQFGDLIIDIWLKNGKVHGWIRDFGDVQIDACRPREPKR